MNLGYTAILFSSTISKSNNNVSLHANSNEKMCTYLLLNIFFHHGPIILEWPYIFVLYNFIVATCSEFLWEYTVYKLRLSLTISKFPCHSLNIYTASLTHLIRPWPYNHHRYKSHHHHQNRQKYPCIPLPPTIITPTCNNHSHYHHHYSHCQHQHHQWRCFVVTTLKCT